MMEPNNLRFRVFVESFKSHLPVVQRIHIFADALFQVLVKFVRFVHMYRCVDSFYGLNYTDKAVLMDQE